jgi:2-polyprenyl-3-methyl-5-hydroxy-6-metoxy-1,4-benzoquinol methylase
MIEQQIQKFYSEIKFPGPYTIENLAYYDEIVCNRYLDFYDRSMTGVESVLDMGCGAGLITNFLARRYPNVPIDAVDFGDGIDQAQAFSEQHGIQNISYHKKNIYFYPATKQYDLVYANGLLPCVPDTTRAIGHIKQFVKPGGTLIFGVYNKMGKVKKRYSPVLYASETLYKDQELVPWDISFSNKQFLGWFKHWQVEEIHPSIGNHFVDFVNLFNYKNGGLTLYKFKFKNGT